MGSGVEVASNVSSFVGNVYLIVWLLGEPQLFVRISADLMGSKSKSFTDGCFGSHMDDVFIGDQEGSSRYVCCVWTPCIMK